jgi:hypothetical protein
MVIVVVRKYRPVADTVTGPDPILQVLGVMERLDVTNPSAGGVTWFNVKANVKPVGPVADRLTVDEKLRILVTLIVILVARPFVRDTWDGVAETVKSEGGPVMTSTWMWMEPEITPLVPVTATS